MSFKRRSIWIFVGLFGVSTYTTQTFAVENSKICNDFLERVQGNVTSGSVVGFGTIWKIHDGRIECLKKPTSRGGHCGSKKKVKDGKSNFEEYTFENRTTKKKTVIRVRADGGKNKGKIVTIQNSGNPENILNTKTMFFNHNQTCVPTKVETQTNPAYTVVSDIGLCTRLKGFLIQEQNEIIQADTSIENIKFPRRSGRSQADHQKFFKVENCGNQTLNQSILDILKLYNGSSAVEMSTSTRDLGESCQNQNDLRAPYKTALPSLVNCLRDNAVQYVMGLGLSDSNFLNGDESRASTSHGGVPPPQSPGLK